MLPPPAKKRRRSEDVVVARALQWLESYHKVSKWMARYDILQLIEQSGGFAVVTDLLPEHVAEGALRILESLPPGRWNDTAAEEDYTHNNIAHRFWSVKAGAAAPSSGSGSGSSRALEALLRAFSLLLPDQFNAFSAARYERGHHIAPHDDRAYTPVRLDTGEVITCSRDVTCVYYLTKDWEESMGGCLVDLEAPPLSGTNAALGGGEGALAAERAARSPSGAAAATSGHAAGQEAAGNGHAAAGSWSGAHAGAAGRQPRGRVYVPRFNSSVFFRVPRYHCVTPLKTDRPRFSVFGWYLQPGELYELYTGDGEARLAAAQKSAAAACAAAAADHQQSSGHQQLLAGGTEHERAAVAKQQRDGKAKASKQRQKQDRQEQLTGEGLHKCKLAQRLLAKVAAMQRQQQTV